MTSVSLRFLLRRGVLSALAIRGGAPRGGQLLGHHNLRAARSPGNHIEFIHEGAHQEDPAAGRTEQVFLSERVRNIGELESPTFVQYVNDHLVGSEIDGKVDYLVGPFL